MPDKETNRELSFEGFLNDVNPAFQEFARQTHDYLLQNGTKLKLQLAKSGYVVSYSHGKNKRVLLNFVFRKSGLFARIYGDRVSDYMDFLDTLPDTMVEAVEKAPACKLCNPRCMKGYAFTLKDAQHQKCRYSCFMFAVKNESVPLIRGFLEREIAERNRDGE